MEAKRELKGERSAESPESQFKGNSPGTNGIWDLDSNSENKDGTLDQESSAGQEKALQ